MWNMILQCITGMSYKVGHEANWQNTSKEPKIIGSNKKTFKFSYRMADKSLSALMLVFNITIMNGKIKFPCEKIDVF